MKTSGRKYKNNIGKNHEEFRKQVNIRRNSSSTAKIGTIKYINIQNMSLRNRTESSRSLANTSRNNIELNDKNNNNSNSLDTNNNNNNNSKNHKSKSILNNKKPSTETEKKLSKKKAKAQINKPNNNNAINSSDKPNSTTMNIYADRMRKRPNNKIIVLEDDSIEIMDENFDKSFPQLKIPILVTKEREQESLVDNTSSLNGDIIANIETDLAKSKDNNDKIKKALLRMIKIVIKMKILD